MMRTRLGFLTPSSNTVLEPDTSAMLADLPVTAHFARFRVTEISMDEQSLAQFTLENQLEAARMLADARVDAIVWSGTSASWLGFDTDERLCAAITQETGIPAGSAVLGVNAIFQQAGVERFGLVTPYTDDIQDRIIAQYTGLGMACVAERHFGVSVNFDFAKFTETDVEAAVRECAAAGVDAVVVMCTNMRGARCAESVEADTGVLVVDSTAAALWHGLRVAGQDTFVVRGWGRIF